MENNDQPPSPPSPPPPLRHSSSAAQLFGYNDSPYSTGVFASIFPPSTMAGNSTCVQCSKPMHYEALDSQVWSTVNGNSAAENVAKNTVNANSGAMNLERRGFYQERIEPCPLSSSIYYGGQEDMYVRSTDLTSKSYTKFFINDDMKDDPNHLLSATRGNWWQGSLYY